MFAKTTICCSITGKPEEKLLFLLFDSKNLLWQKVDVACMFDASETENLVLWIQMFIFILQK